MYAAICGDLFQIHEMQQTALNEFRANIRTLSYKVRQPEQSWIVVCRMGTQSGHAN